MDLLQGRKRLYRVGALRTFSCFVGMSAVSSPETRAALVRHSENRRQDRRRYKAISYHKGCED